MGYSEKDRSILRELGEQVAGIAAMPINDQRKELYRRINNLEKARILWVYTDWLKQKQDLLR